MFLSTQNTYQFGFMNSDIDLVLKRNTSTIPYTSLISGIVGFGIFPHVQHNKKPKMFTSLLR